LIVVWGPKRKLVARCSTFFEGFWGIFKLFWGDGVQLEHICDFIELLWAPFFPKFLSSLDTFLHHFPKILILNPLGHLCYAKTN
jgi:hypothetical protein